MWDSTRRCFLYYSWGCSDSWKMFWHSWSSGLKQTNQWAFHFVFVFVFLRAFRNACNLYNHIPTSALEIFYFAKYLCCNQSCHYSTARCTCWGFHLARYRLKVSVTFGSLKPAARKLHQHRVPYKPVGKGHRCSCLARDSTGLPGSAGIVPLLHEIHCWLHNHLIACS